VYVDVWRDAGAGGSNMVWCKWKQHGWLVDIWAEVTKGTDPVTESQLDI
jgi:hypothetical protein